MAALSRREFLKRTATDAAVAGFLTARVARLRANPLGLPIGSQTYPHRQMIKDGNFAGLAKALADIGVQSVEMCHEGKRRSPEDDAGLTRSNPQRARTPVEKGTGIRR